MLALALAACDEATAPRYHPEIGNAPNNFQFQVTDLRGVSDDLTYQWRNDGVRADVNQATALTGGSAVLTVSDAAGATVYQQSLTANGTFETAAGVAGTWRIRVRFTDATGTVNFRVQRHP